MTAHSFKAPFYLVKGAISFWQIGGSTVITDDFVRLTPAEKSRQGWMWNAKSVSFPSWEVELNFRIGSTSSLGADGMAFWYTKNSKREGPVFGSEDNWEGLGIFFDTFDNDAQGDNPYISVVLNNGHTRYQDSPDAKTIQLGGCKYFYRNYDTRVRIGYFDNTLQVLVRTQGDWTLCGIFNVDLPMGYYFGLSAATGGLADNHDVMRFETSRLIAKGSNDIDFPDTTDNTRTAEQIAEQEERIRQVLDQSIQAQQNTEKTQKEIEDNRLDDLRNRLSKMKSEFASATNENNNNNNNNNNPPPPPPQQTEHVPETNNNNAGHQPQVAISGSGVETLALAIETMVKDLDRLKDQQLQMNTNLQHLQGTINTFSQSIARDAQKLEQISQQNQQFVSFLEQLVQSTATRDDLRNVNFEGSGLQSAVDGVKQQLSELRSFFENKMRETATQQALNSIVGALSDLKVKVDQTKNSQASIEQNLQRNTDQLQSTIQSSTSFGFWAYFVFFQLLFGIAFMWWKKYRDEANKKLI
eukprot:CAMPEP_0168569900 /NCGR_PEP_ID=MMETSP0413-20121227/16427_1 /TAXON_ID=136452 /ORGANISM="Filamoeba nolandi, Strain NC-AS-23-1" /LENGTH=525 /DNA_ID=CAMNT_0008602473 /DNA_START=190 /DNA_END=1767 /DNA_ORIENTATION=+